MKRRLFLKSSTAGIGGAIILPTFFYGCPGSVDDGPQGAAMGIELFKDSARLFDASIAELRLAGSGSLASAESEDPDLAGVAEMAGTQVTAIAASIDGNFAESSFEMIEAAESMNQSGAEMFAEAEFPFAEAELAQDYALLKVLKASTILASAAKTSPLPIRKVIASGKMVANATAVHSSIETGAEAEMIESSEHLLAHSEEYVGAAETHSGEVAFILGVHDYALAAEHYKQSENLLGGETLLTSSDNIALSTEYFPFGLANLNAEAEIFNEDGINSAAALLPFSKNLLTAAEIYSDMAEGAPAEKGAAEMLGGAAEILSDTKSNALNLAEGGEILDGGANNFIAGTITFNSAEDYIGLAKYYLEGAESLGNDPSKTAEAEAEILDTAELLHPASENFHQGAEALHELNNVAGMESLEDAVHEIIHGANNLESLARSPKSKIGAAEMVKGAEMAEAGAIESAGNNGEFLHLGAQSIEQGTYNLMKGAAEFIEGYK